MSVISPATLALMQQPVTGKNSGSSTGQIELDEEGPTRVIESKHGKYPSFGEQRKSSSGNDSIQLSLNNTMEKFNSIQLVKQLHADGD